MVLVSILDLAMQPSAAPREIQPSAAMKLKEGASFVTTERASGSGKVTLPAAKSPPKSAAKKGAWGGLLGKMVKQREENAKQRSTIDSLNRLNALLDKLDHGEMMSRVPRTPKRELEFILGALNPIELGLAEPFKRFEAGVEAVYKQLMGRDNVAEDKLQVIRAAIMRALERGNWGTLPPLERESETPAIATQPPAPASSFLPSEAAAEPARAKESDAQERQRQKAEREAAETDMSNLMYNSYERQGQREQLLGGLHTWLDSAADDLESALEAMEEAGDTREMQGVMSGPGQVEENLGRQPYVHQGDFNAQLLIERGKEQFGTLLTQLEAGGSRVSRTSH